MFHRVYYLAPPTFLITQAQLHQVYNYTFISNIIYSKMNQRPAFQGVTIFQSAIAWKEVRKKNF
jgi:hypothetical protein